MGIEMDNGFIHKMHLILGKTVCGIPFGGWTAGSSCWEPVTCPDCLKRKGWKLVRSGIQKTMKIKATREELAARWARKIDERRKLALEFATESQERKFLEGMVSGLDLLLAEFLMWDETEEKVSTG